MLPNPRLILGLIGGLAITWMHGFSTAANKYNREAEIARQKDELAQKQIIIESLRRDQEVNAVTLERARKDADQLSADAKTAEVRLNEYIQKLEKAASNTGGSNGRHIQKNSCVADTDFLRALDNVVPKSRSRPKK